MAVIRAQVVIPSVSAIPADACVNTFHFIANADNADATTMTSRLQDFYTGATGQTLAVSARFSVNNALAGTIKFYNLAENKPRAPFSTAGITFLRGTTAAPPELAVCASYQGLQVSGFPQARRRGRIFLGPLAQNGFESTNGKVQTTFRQDIVTASKRLCDAGDLETPWVVVSNVGGVSALPVVSGWVDDAPDVQRRRGVTATVRQVWQT